MSEPKLAANGLEEIESGLWHWTTFDDRIGFRSDAFAIQGARGIVLIDPLPLEERALDRLGEVEAICLTIQSHQRSAWRDRRSYGAKVWAPAGAQGLEEPPDIWYRANDELPGGLRAFHAPGPCEASYALLRGDWLFLGDLLMRENAGPVGFVPSEFQDDADRTRSSVRALLPLGARVLLFGHGEPVRRDGSRTLARALSVDLAPVT
jgi:glyoxylase-like metal-dependent hydrolase (beta-lactamase superfamily II)